MRLVSINPATARQIASHRGHTRAEVERAVARAHTAHLAWRKLTPKVRAKHLRAVGRGLLARREQLATLATTEMGKPVKQARTEVEKSALACEF